MNIERDCRSWIYYFRGRTRLLVHHLCLFISVIWYDLLNQLMPHLTHYTPPVQRTRPYRLTSSTKSILRCFGWSRQFNFTGWKRIPWTNIFTFQLLKIRIRLDFHVWACVYGTYDIRKFRCNWSVKRRKSVFNLIFSTLFASAAEIPFESKING